ncbi:hypothetical protein ACFVT2_11090 [Streptomyces sp. NPDC058000]|uniref:hypothetical protein n=1 Tax=Streptomyces sp. NPDC058000 TaxID=3346299 RepID=UPI0036E96337
MPEESIDAPDRPDRFPEMLEERGRVGSAGSLPRPTKPRIAELNTAAYGPEAAPKSRVAVPGPSPGDR